MSIQDLRQNPQDISNFYLANIYHATINPSAPNISSPLPASPPPFSPPNYAVWVNGLWFMSLVISLTCALLATFLQQWARRYLKVTHSRSSPDKRARIRAFFAEGIEKCLLPFAVEILPTLLHISLFLFFAGLVVFLLNVNLTIFKLVLSWVGICVALYGCITLMPIIRHDSPYYTPLSSLAWPIVFGMAYFVALVSWRLLCCISWWRRGENWLGEFLRHCTDFLEQGMQKTVEKTALKSSSDIVNRAFMWTFDSLDEDHELERFFSDLPGFRRSNVVDDPLPSLPFEQRLKLYDTLVGLIDRTFSSDLLPAPVKERRAIICAKAAGPHIPYALDIFDIILSEYQATGPLASEIVQFVTGWRENIGEDVILNAQAIISMIVARVQLHDDSWFILASNTLGVPETVLRDWAAHRHNLSLAILIYVVREQFTHFDNSSWPNYDFQFVLEAASEFDVQNTSPGLQNKFCTLWNQIVRKVQNDNNRWMAGETLRPIRNAYIALHQDTNSAPTQFSPSTDNLDDILIDPFSYPVCQIAGHHPDSSPHTHDDTASTTFIGAVPHSDDDTVLVSSFLCSSPYANSTSAHAPLCLDESLTGSPPLDNNVSLPVQTTLASHHIPSTAPNLVTTLAIHGKIDASPRTMSLSIPEPSTSPLPSILKASTSPPDVVAVEHTAVSHTASGDLNVPSSSSPTPVLHDMLPIGLLLLPNSTVTGSDHAFLAPEPHSSTQAPTVRGRSRSWLSSAPDMNGVAEEEDGAQAVLGTEDEDDVPYPSLAIHADIMVTSDVPPPSPSPQPIVDLAIPAGRSRSSLDAEHTGEPSPHGQYDIV